MSDELRFFDANCFFGHTPASQPGAPIGAGALLDVMDQSGIAEALVYHPAAAGYDFTQGNELLLEEIADSPRLHPSFVVAPPHTGELPPSRQLAESMVRAGVRAARLFPKRIGPLRAWLYGELFSALADGQLLLLLDFELPHYSQHLTGIDWDGLDWMLGEYPSLPVVLPRIGQGVDRTLLPLMDRRPNLYLETSYYLGTGALERVARRLGPERLLFGTGMSRYAPGPAITLITYSGLDDRGKQAVAGDNLRRLLGRQGGG